MKGTVSVMVTRRSACRNGSGRRITVFSTLNIVLTPARPRASVTTKRAENPQLARRLRSAKRMLAGIFILSHHAPEGLAERWHGDAGRASFPENHCYTANRMRDLWLSRRALLLGLGTLPLMRARAQGVSTRAVKPQPRGKPSGLPFNACFTDVAAQAGLHAPL